MFSTPEQFSAATKSAFESQFLMMSTLTQKAFAGVEKLVELNLSVARSAMDESSQTIKTLASAKSPQEFFSLSTAQSKPGSEKAMAYVRGVASIASEVQAEITKITESQVADAKRNAATLMDEMSRAAPAGSENMVAMFKTALGNANAGYEKATASTKQVVAKIESNMDEAMKTVAVVAEKSTTLPATKK
ncbi:TIGR01841 family phasin [Actimicrobium antarcticum]|uniref:Phasin family protein n=1 Tax=Actimicrobium antarcticum TaxID=1051899 RepID=A0ABP7SY94_9BURK